MKKLNSIQQVSDQIFITTMRIQKRYPSLYNVLNETPLEFGYNSNHISIIELKQYLSTLHMQFQTFDLSRNVKKIDI